MTEATPATKTNFPTETLEIKNLKRAIVTKSSLVITGRGISRYSLFENLPASFMRNIRLLAYGSLLKNGLEILPEENFYSVFNLWGTGYHHWLTEVALKLVLFEQELKTGTILMPAKSPRFIDDFFSLFDFKKKIIEKNLYARHLKIVTNPNSGHYHKASLQKLRDRLFEKVSVKKTARRKIYISRRNSRARRIINEAELLERLKPLGFECLELENFSFAEQVEIFHNCDALASIHGAGLTNAIFMPEGSRVIEFFPEFTDAESQMNACYHRLSAALGHRHDFVFCRREFPEKKYHLDTDNIFFDAERLEKFL